jgi:DNA-binding CsgD family transcriptional regulator
MASTPELRPVERRVLRWVEHGLDDAEIARKFQRGERWASQVRFLAGMERPASSASPASPRADDGGLRPLERRLLRWREQGVGHEELSGRFRRSPAFLARVEQYARYKLAATA